MRLNALFVLITATILASLRLCKERYLFHGACTSVIDSNSKRKKYIASCDSAVSLSEISEVKEVAAALWLQTLTS